MEAVDALLDATALEAASEAIPPSAAFASLSTLRGVPMGRPPIVAALRSPDVVELRADEVESGRSVSYGSAVASIKSESEGSRLSSRLGSAIGTATGSTGVQFVQLDAHVWDAGPVGVAAAEGVAAALEGMAAEGDAAPAGNDPVNPVDMRRVRALLVGGRLGGRAVSGGAVGGCATSGAAAVWGRDVDKEGRAEAGARPEDGAEEGGLATRLLKTPPAQGAVPMWPS